MRRRTRNRHDLRIPFDQLSAGQTRQSKQRMFYVCDVDRETEQAVKQRAAWTSLLADGTTLHVVGITRKQLEDLVPAARIL